MHKKICLLSLIAVLLLAAEPVKLVRLTIINKAEMPVAIRLQSVDDFNKFYYLQVAAGSRALPTEQTFTLAPDLYNMIVYYVETYDPVYGFKCSQPVPNQMLATRNQRLVILPCGEVPGNVGEPSMRKYLPYPIVQYFFSKYWVTRFIY